MTTTARSTQGELTGHLTEEGEALRRTNELSPARRGREPHDVIVIGGGQAGLSVGYQLARRHLKFVILDASARVGDAWRHRWDSLRLFSDARLSTLEGLRFPGPQHRFPGKDEMADYLEAYAARFALPVRPPRRKYPVLPPLRSAPLRPESNCRRSLASTLIPVLPIWPTIS